MTAVVDGLEHTPTRPGWWCAACGDDWPCAVAKVQLAEQFAGARSALVIYLAVCQWEAIDDATLSPRGGIRIVNNMRERFVGWTDALERNGRSDVE